MDGPLTHDHGFGTVHSRLTWSIIQDRGEGVIVSGTLSVPLDCVRSWMGCRWRRLDQLPSEAGSVSPQKHSLRTAACRLHDQIAEPVPRVKGTTIL